MAHSKGATILRRLDYVREHYGEEGVAKLLDALPGPTHRVVDGGVIASQWVPYSAYVDVITTADQIFGDGDFKLAEAMGRYTAEQNLSKVYKLFYKLGSPSFVISKGMMLYSQHQDSGRCDVETPAKRKCIVDLADHPELHPALGYSLAGWAVGAIKMSGGGLARREIVEESYDTVRHFVFSVQWV